MRRSWIPWCYSTDSFLVIGLMGAEGAGEVISRPLSIIFGKLWGTGQVPEGWRKANVTSVFKKSKKRDAGNYRPVSFPSIPGKVMA